MKPIVLTLALGLLVTGGIATVVASRAPQAIPARSGASASIGVQSSAIEILTALPFEVDEPFVHEWRAEKPLVRSGYVLVLRVDPALARPHDTYESVLYVGDQTAERCVPLDGDPDLGDELVVLVPAPLARDGRVDLDLATTPIWFGGFELPERVDAARIASERAAALAAGVGPARRAASLTLRASAAETIHARTRLELQRAYVEELFRK